MSSILNKKFLGPNLVGPKRDNHRPALPAPGDPEFTEFFESGKKETRKWGRGLPAFLLSLLNLRKSSSVPHTQGYGGTSRRGRRRSGREFFCPQMPSLPIYTEFFESGKKKQGNGAEGFLRSCFPY
jgi:hypothetical protein